MRASKIFLFFIMLTLSFSALAEEKSWYDRAWDKAGDLGNEYIVNPINEKIVDPLKKTWDEKVVKPIETKVEEKKEQVIQQVVNAAVGDLGDVKPEDLTKAVIDKASAEAHKQMKATIAKVANEISNFNDRAEEVFESLMMYMIFFALFITAVQLVWNESGFVSGIAQALVGFIFKAGFFMMLALGGAFMLVDVPIWLAKAGSYIATGTWPVGAYYLPNVIEVIGGIYEKIWNGTPKGIISGFFSVVAIGAVAFTIAVIVYNYLIAIFETMMISVSSIIPLAFGVFDQTKNWAYDQIKYAVGLGFKMLVFAIAIALIPDLLKAGIGALPEKSNVVSLIIFLFVFVSLLGFALVLPKIAQAAMSGSVTDSSKSFAQAMGIMSGSVTAGAAVVTAGAAVGAKGLGAANAAGGAILKDILGGGKSGGAGGSSANNFSSSSGNLSKVGGNNGAVGAGIPQAAAPSYGGSTSQNQQNSSLNQKGGNTSNNQNSNFNQQTQEQKGAEAQKADTQDAVKAAMTERPSGVDFNAGSSANGQASKNDSVKNDSTGISSQKGGVEKGQMSGYDAQKAQNGEKTSGKEAEKPKSLADSLLDKSAGQFKSGLAKVISNSTDGVMSGEGLGKALDATDSTLKFGAGLGKAVYDGFKNRKNNKVQEKM